MADVLIMGGGVIGLAIALELRQAGLSVTLHSHDIAAAAAQAAAGMLAPQAEQIPPSPLLDLCLRSRDLYPEWIQKLEQRSGVDTGYWACGILAPIYSLREQRNEATWLDGAVLRDRHPGLSPEILGAHWYPNDAQVDNRALVRALRIAAQDAGVTIHEGAIVEKILHHDHTVTSIQTTAGTWTADHYILATGAWTRDLLPIPVFPRKGQMASVRAPNPNALPLQTVLFGPEIYIVPRQNGRIIIGATSEDVGFTPHNTPLGIQTLFTRATRLFPPLAQFPIEELWWGFRPATPDECPILGDSPYRNLTLATGHYRNGILLAPITAKLVANRVAHQTTDPLLAAFHWSRFIR